MKELSPLSRKTRDCLMLLGCAFLGVGGGFMLTFALAHGGGIQPAAMASVAIAVSAFGLVRAAKELLRKPK